MVENDESMDAPKNVLFHWKYNNYQKRSEIVKSRHAPKFGYFNRNMKIMKIRLTLQKSTTPRMLIISNVLFKGF